MKLIYICLCLRRIENEKGLPFFDIVAFLNVEFLDRPLVLRLNDLDIADRNDLAIGDSNLIYLADKCPNRPCDEERDNGPEDESPDRRGRLFCDFKNRRQEFLLLAFLVADDEVLPKLFKRSYHFITPC